MEFDIGLYPEGGSNSLQAQNPEDKQFRTILVAAEKAHESPLTMKVTIQEVHHGKLRWERRNVEGTLLLFTLQLESSKVVGRRCLKISVTMEFSDLGGKMSDCPAVFKVAPSPDEDRYLDRTEVKSSWADIGGSSVYKYTKPVKFSARLVTDTHWSDEKSGGPENAVTWSLEEENITGHGEGGIPSFLQAAVLLRRTTTKAFRVQLRVAGEVDWKSNARGLLSLSSGAQNRIVDPILLTPGAAQEGVHNSLVTGIRDRDLLDMENLPVADYYKIAHPVEESA
ncbi:hypothetical protein F5B18DRAFT_674304 [Nemania serpens]|nr:hypothetical protein F5B18DRAFT_674304 [Nemania serpens]